MTHKPTIANDHSTHCELCGSTAPYTQDLTVWLEWLHGECPGDLVSGIILAAKQTTTLLPPPSRESEKPLDSVLRPDRGARLPPAPPGPRGAPRPPPGKRKSVRPKKRAK